jgi:hypothetical protein
MPSVGPDCTRASRAKNSRSSCAGYP